ncbi:chloride channel protein [Brachyspira pilosicoli]|uniref:chloride channel protein n=1 Tax=Brachyspira pilosicoli TaxID=52584 RepID=UPI0030047E4A
MKPNFEAKYIKLYVLSSFIGATVGFIVSFYRMILYRLSINVFYVSNFILSKWYYPIIMFIVLISLGSLIGLILRHYPQIRGAGVPQIKYYLSLNEPKNIVVEIALKLFGSMISFASGLSLGRAGPSMHIGTLVGLFYHKHFYSHISKYRRYLIIAGACAGMTATFSAPFTGIAFSFEELKENKNHIVFVCIALSSIFSILVIEHILGQSMILNFNLPRILEVRHYISLLPLGLICGLLASFQNILMNTFSKFYQNIKNDILRPVPAFIVAGIMIMFFPYVLGSGDLLIGSIVMDKFPIHMLFILIFVKLFYTSVCSTSGAVGGVFFPTFILGSSIGSLYDIFLVHYFPEYAMYGDLFIVLGITSMMSGITRTPIMVCILILEISSSVSNFVALMIVAIISYMVAKVLGVTSIYDFKED